MCLPSVPNLGVHRCGRFSVSSPAFLSRGALASGRSRRILSSAPVPVIPPTGGCRTGLNLVRRAFYLGNEPTPEANRYGVGSAARLKLRQQVAHM